MSLCHMSHRRRTAKRKQIIELYGMRCWLCNRPIRNKRDFSIDHALPRSKGGGHNIENLRPAHRACNFKRADRDPPELLLTENMILRVPEAA